MATAQLTPNAKTNVRFDPELDLRLEREIDVPRELVWKAWTEPEHLKKWFCPRPWMTTEAEIDLRPGGLFRTVMEGPNGEHFDGSGCYLEVIANERLVWTNLMRDGFRPLPEEERGFGYTASLTLDEIAPGKTLYVAHVMHTDRKGRDEHDAMGFADGWSKALEQLIETAKTMR